MSAFRLLSGAFLAIFFCCSSYAATVAEVKKDYEQNKNLLLKKKFLIRQDYIIALGSTRLRGKDTAADIAARMDAQNNLIKAWESARVIPGVPEYVTPAMVQKVFNSWKKQRRLTYQLKDCRILHKFSKKTVTFCVVVCSKKGVKPSVDKQITWQMIYQDYKNSPRRDELFFYEIAEIKELESLKIEIEKRLSAQTNQQFAAMFFGQDAEAEKAAPAPESPTTTPAASAGELDLLELALQKTAPAAISEKSPLPTLISAVRTKPYDVELCSWLQKKFSALQMPRAAQRMQIAGEKALAIRQIKAQPAEAAQTQNAPAERLPDKSAGGPKPPQPAKNPQKTEQK